jgi:hypothetical protein
VFDSKGYTVLHRTVRNDDFEHMEMLLSHKRINPEFVSRDGWHVIALANDARSLKLLLDCERIEITGMTDSDAFTIYGRSVIKKNVELMEILLSHT